MSQDNKRYLAETEDGFQLSVPEEKMDAWRRASHSAPLSKAEQQLKDRIVERLYGPKK